MSAAQSFDGEQRRILDGERTRETAIRTIASIHARTPALSPANVTVLILHLDSAVRSCSIESLEGLASSSAAWGRARGTIRPQPVRSSVLTAGHGFNTALRPHLAHIHDLLQRSGIAK